MKLKAFNKYFVRRYLFPMHLCQRFYCNTTKINKSNTFANCKIKLRFAT